jgi:hypothetical protein
MAEVGGLAPEFEGVGGAGVRGETAPPVGRGYRPSDPCEERLASTGPLSAAHGQRAGRSVAARQKPRQYCPEVQ